jgi:hypothetical protein
MKQSILLVFCCAFPLLMKAQQDIVTSGGMAVGANGNVSFTIGQTLYRNYATAQANENQGVQQPYEIVSPAGIADQGYPTFSVKLYPNPTEDVLFITTDQISPISYTLYDLRGRLVWKGEAGVGETKLNMTELAPASYSLELTSPGYTTQNYRIIKH